MNNPTGKEMAMAMAGIPGHPGWEGLSTPGRDAAMAMVGAAPTIEVEGREVPVPVIFVLEAEKLFTGQIGIPRQQIIEAIAGSTWAQRWSQGTMAFVLGPEGVAALPEEVRRTRVNALARRLAERVAPVEVAAPAPPPPAPAPRARARRAAE